MEKIMKTVMKKSFITSLCAALLLLSAGQALSADQEQGMWQRGAKILLVGATAGAIGFLIGATEDAIYNPLKIMYKYREFRAPQEFQDLSDEALDAMTNQHSWRDRCHTWYLKKFGYNTVYTNDPCNLFGPYPSAAAYYITDRNICLSPEMLKKGAQAPVTIRVLYHENVHVYYNDGHNNEMSREYRANHKMTKALFSIGHHDESLKHALNGARCETCGAQRALNTLNQCLSKLEKQKRILSTAYNRGTNTDDVKNYLCTNPLFLLWFSIADGENLKNFILSFKKASNTPNTIDDFTHYLIKEKKLLDHYDQGTKDAWNEIVRENPDQLERLASIDDQISIPSGPNIYDQTKNLLWSLFGYGSQEQGNEVDDESFNKKPEEQL